MKRGLEYKKTTPEAVWAGFEETDRLLKETSEQLKKSTADFDRRMKKLEELTGSWANNHGAFAEEYFFNSISVALTVLISSLKF